MSTLAPPAPPPAGPPAQRTGPAPRPGRRRLNLFRTALRQPAVLLGIATAAVLAVLVVIPLVGLVSTTLRPEGLEAWRDVLASPLSPNLFYGPLTR